jgi:hypothetical protein
VTEIKGIVFGMDISNGVPDFNYVLVNKLAKCFFGGPSPQWNVFPVLRKLRVDWKGRRWGEEGLKKPPWKWR